MFVAKWNPPLSDQVKDWVVQGTSGYCGADMKALCTEAALIALKRVYPQVYTSSLRLQLDLSKITVTKGDLNVAMLKLAPAAARSSISSGSGCGKPLDSIHKLLLQKTFDLAYTAMRAAFPPLKDIDSVGQRPPAVGGTGGVQIGDWSAVDRDSWISAVTNVEDGLLPLPGGVGGSSLAKGSSLVWDMFHQSATRSRLMVIGQEDGSGQSKVCSALIHAAESFPLISLDLASLIAYSNAGNTTVEQALVMRVQEAWKLAPCVIYIPDILNWWESLPLDIMKTIIASMMYSTPVGLAVLWLSSCSLVALNPVHQPLESHEGIGTNVQSVATAKLHGDNRSDVLAGLWG